MTFTKSNYWTTKRKLILFFGITIPAAVMLFAHQWSKEYYLGVNPWYNTSISCMEERFYIVKKLNNGNPNELVKAGNILVFKSNDLAESVYKKEVKFGKIVTGTPGQKVVIDQEGNTFIDDEKISKRSVFMVNTLVREGFENLVQPVSYTLADDEFFASGGLVENSFDSRFWGPAKINNITGHVVWKGITWL